MALNHLVAKIVSPLVQIVKRPTIEAYVFMPVGAVSSPPK